MGAAEEQGMRLSERIMAKARDKRHADLEAADAALIAEAQHEYAPGDTTRAQYVRIIAADARRHLRRIAPSGTRVYTLKTGHRVRLFVATDSRRIDEVTRLAAVATGKAPHDSGILCKGIGYDSADEIVREVARALYGSPLEFCQEAL